GRAMKKLVGILLVGCVAAVSHETLTTTVLFDREIVRILDKHCVMCHVENGPAFPLATYEQTWLQKRPIRAAVIARHMPPWAAFFTSQETGQWIGRWTPWFGYTSLPKGTAYRLPARARIVAEIHCQGITERVVEQGTVGLFFGEEASPDLISDIVLDGKTVRL